ncbi:UbiA family prenyltransferase [Methanolobus sp. ZRKC3]|uniref:UbiA family prenyltransferase n=1 Tax=Methanolobus sp. ZRKC3 TaxID=3125786 RepID=UPI003243DB81
MERGLKTIISIPSFLSLTRFWNSLFGAFTIILSGILSADFAGYLTDYLFASISIVLLGMGSFSINDYFDHDIDRFNKRTDRPIVQGNVGRRTALHVAMLCFSLSLVVAIRLNFIFFIFLSFNAIVFFLYSYYMKKLFLIKNILIAYSFFATIIAGTIVSDSIIEPLILYYAIMGFIVGLAFEIMIDIRDVAGDQKFGVQTIAGKFSPKIAALSSVFFYAIVMILDSLPFFIRVDPALYQDNLFLLLILIPMMLYILVSRSLILDSSKDNILALRKKTLGIMQFGSLAYLIGYLF